MERKLTTILCADAVGFSRLMGADEEDTLARLRVYRGIIEELVSSHGGRIFSGAGDSVVVEFASPVEAVRCAAAIQARLFRENEDVEESRRMRFRVGINLGDVLIDGDDLQGDGVNVAARLESIAEPGGICISEPVYAQVSRRVDLPLEAMGPQNLKNIAEPVNTYRAAMDGAVAKPSTGRRGLLVAGIGLAVAAAALAGWFFWPDAGTPVPGRVDDRPSVVILPFDNLSGDPDEDHISDGISEDLTTDLSRVGGLFVFSRNVAGELKPRIAPGRRESVDPVAVAKELDADFVLEGSVRRAGGKLRINAQLIDGKTGGHLWADRFDRDTKDVFVVLDEVILKIVDALKVQLTTGERDALADAQAVNPDAWDLVLRGIVELRRFTRDSNKEAEVLFLKAAEIDPGYARAWASVSFALSIRNVFGWTDTPEENIEQAMNYAEKALALDDSTVQAHLAIHNIHMRRKRPDLAVESGKRIINLDPSNPDGFVALGVAHNYAGNHDEGLKALQKALFLAPGDPFFFVWIEGMCLFMLERYEEALVRFEKVVDQNPAFVGGLRYLAATQAYLGQIEDAEWTVQELLLLEPDDTLAKEREWLDYIEPEDIERYIEGLRRAGVPE